MVHKGESQKGDDPARFQQVSYDMLFGDCGSYSATLYLRPEQGKIS